MNYPRYFMHSRRLCGQVAGYPVPVGMRELDAAEAEPHLRAKEKREMRQAAEMAELLAYLDRAADL